MSNPPLFDTHVHLDCLPERWDPLAEVQEARRVGVEYFLLPGVRRRRWPDLLRLCREIPGVWAAPGLHPQAAGEWDRDAERSLRECLSGNGVVAVGEIGLDALIETPAELQERAFRGQLRLAAEARLPVLVHCRRRTERLLSILKEERGGRFGGIFHAFSGSVETALQVVDLGFAVAFGGTLTYPDARRAPEVLNALPPHAVVIETDAPDIPPHPHRGEDNRPCRLPLVAARVAQVRGWSLEETARITTENAKKILRIGE